MKFILPCFDSTFTLGRQSGQINGGTAWLTHLKHTLEDMGHQAELVENGTPIPEADVCIIQSEWYAIPGQKERLQELRQQGMKLVVILGHFIGGVYFNPKDIEADLFISTWKGPVVDNFKERVHYFPHAYCTVCDKPGELYRGDIIWVGNNYPLRSEDWFEGLDINKVSGILPNEIGQIYRAAKVCPNIHGAFQKNEVSTHPSTLADQPGNALNERIFQVSGSGGFQIADDNPQIRDFFDETELVCAKDAADFKEKIHYFMDKPEERQAYIERIQKKILEKHTYHHRINDLLEWLNLS